MKTTLELYGIKANELANMTYKEALKHKLSALDGRLEGIIDKIKALPSAGAYEQNVALESEYRKITKAIDFNEELLGELKR